MPLQLLVLFDNRGRSVPKGYVDIMEKEQEFGGQFVLFEPCLSRILSMTTSVSKGSSPVESMADGCWLEGLVAK